MLIDIDSNVNYQYTFFVFTNNTAVGRRKNDEVVF